MLTYAQQSKEMAIVEQDKLAKRIQEFRTQAEYESSQDSATVDDIMTGNCFHAVDVNKSIEAIMQSSSNGEVTVWIPFFSCHFRMSCRTVINFSFSILTARFRQLDKVIF